MTAFRGITWHHPRGYLALRAAARERAGSLDLTWDTQPLEAFEAHPIEELATRYDLIVLDHPHLGDALLYQCLRPLDELFSAQELAALADRSVGATYASYVLGGRAWALPLDAAAQVLATRRDTREPPTTWEEVLAWSGKPALSLAGPHAALTLFSMCVAFGAPPREEGPLLDLAAVEAAFDVLQRLHARAPSWTGSLNPIGLLDAMAQGADLDLVPLVYGYVNYADPRPGDLPVFFHEAPARAPGGRPGSTLGGTGLAVSRRCQPSAALIDHLRWLVSPLAQQRFLPEHEGQPSARAVWSAPSPEVPRFYRDTSRTLESAWVRPRSAGYVQFQARASRLVREALLHAGRPATLVADLNQRWADERGAAQASTPKNEEQARWDA